MLKPILISLSPNTTSRDFSTALKLLLQPWLWQKGSAEEKLEAALKTKLNHSYGFLLNAGRNGLYLALKALDLKPGDEVLCQAFTCVAVPNAIIWAGAKPVFVDTKPNQFNLSLTDLKKKITPRTKALIVQHTFGVPDEIGTLATLCRQHKIILIEDCAHALGAKVNGRPVGSFGDMTMLSFGRDKIISSVFGGVLLTNDRQLAKKINQLTNLLTYPPKIWILKQLLHPILFSLIVPTYFYFGKYLLMLIKKLGLISLPVPDQEKIGRMVILPQKMPNALAQLALTQLSQLDTFNQHRCQIAKYYANKLHQPVINPEAVYLRYSLLVGQPDQLIQKAKKHQLLLGNWYRPLIAPAGVSRALISQASKSCPNADSISHRVINLPTHPRLNFNQLDRIINFIKPHVKF
ncbi:MAG: aminotransferase class I/II-fold pyridoxal phosphate-dependent enzyme [Candidatus Beckwithbacteria bacterium]